MTVSGFCLISAVHFQSGRIYFEGLAGEPQSIFICGNRIPERMLNSPLAGEVRPVCLLGTCIYTPHTHTHTTNIHITHTRTYTTHTLTQKVELRKAENPWIRWSDCQKTMELYRKLQGILNKLTPQKFPTLAEQALMLKINTEERLKGVIDKIFTNVSV